MTWQQWHNGDTRITWHHAAQSSYKRPMGCNSKKPRTTWISVGGNTAAHISRMLSTNSVGSLQGSPSQCEDEAVPVGSAHQRRDGNTDNTAIRTAVHASLLKEYAARSFNVVSLMIALTSASFARGSRGYSCTSKHSRTFVGIVHKTLNIDERLQITDGGNILSKPLFRICLDPYIIDATESSAINAQTIWCSSCRRSSSNK